MYYIYYIYYVSSLAITMSKKFVMKIQNIFKKLYFL